MLQKKQIKHFSHGAKGVVGVSVRPSGGIGLLRGSMRLYEWEGVFGNAR